MAKKVTLYCTQHPDKGREFDEDHAKRILSKSNSGWWIKEKPLKKVKKSNVSINPDNTGEDKET